MLPVDQLSNEVSEFQPINLLTRKRSKKSLAAENRETLKQVVNYTHLSASDKYIVLMDNKILEVQEICRKLPKVIAYLFSLLNLLIADLWLRLIDLNSHIVAFVIRATAFQREKHLKTGI